MRPLPARFRQHRLLLMFLLIAPVTAWAQTRAVDLPGVDWLARNASGTPWLGRGASRIAELSPLASKPWVELGGEALVLGAVFWTLSYLRFRRLLQAKKNAERELAACLVELESEKSVLTLLQRLPARNQVTQAWNRTAIMEILVREMLRSVRENSHLGIVIAEIDDYEGIEATYGKSGAEAVTQQMAERLHNVMRAYDAVGHYRDNDFMIVLPGWNPESAPQRIVSLLDTIGLRPCLIDDVTVRVTSSLGVAAFDPRTDSPYPEELLRRADEALHTSKAAGPNHAVVAPR